MQRQQVFCFLHRRFQRKLRLDILAVALQIIKCAVYILTTYFNCSIFLPVYAVTVFQRFRFRPRPFLLNIHFTENFRNVLLHYRLRIIQRFTGVGDLLFDADNCFIGSSFRAVFYTVALTGGGFYAPAFLNRNACFFSAPPKVRA